MFGSWAKASVSMWAVSGTSFNCARVISICQPQLSKGGIGQGSLVAQRQPVTALNS
jgi:hypothetical protein